MSKNNEKHTKSSEKNKPIRPSELSGSLTFANLSVKDEQLAAMTHEERFSLLESLNYRQKYQLLQVAPDAVDLLRKMTPEDLYFTIEAAGRTDAMDLVLQATPEQTLRLFDVDCWEKDRFLVRKQLDWFGLMIQADMEKAAEKLREMDLAYVVAFLSGHIEVRRYEWSDDQTTIPADLFTLDDQYQFRFLDPENTDLDRLTVFLLQLYIQNFELYKDAMEWLIWESPTVLEEHAYREHCRRLADAGYPDYLESLALFSPFDAETFKAGLDRRRIDKSAFPRAETNLPTYFRVMDEPGHFFTDLLEELDDEATKERIRAELVLLANRAAVARKALGDLDELSSVLTLVRDHLATGLQFLSDSDASKALELLQSVPLADIFRCGHALATRLQQQARRFLERHAPNRDPRSLALLPRPARELLVGLSGRTPLLPADFVENRSELHELSGIEEYRKAASSIARLEFVFGMLFERLKLDKAAIARRTLGFVGEEDSPLLLVKITLTAFARHLLGLDEGVIPLTAEDFKAFLERTLIATPPGGFRPSEDFTSELRAWMQNALGDADEKSLDGAEGWAGLCTDAFADLAAELASLERGDAIGLSRVLFLE